MSAGVCYATNINISIHLELCLYSPVESFLICFGLCQLLRKKYLVLLPLLRYVQQIVANHVCLPFRAGYILQCVLVELPAVAKDSV